jgi:hypothetical protein
VLHQAATSDGALYIAWPRDTGNVFDDMEAPHHRRLGPFDDTFAAQVRTGRNADDYLTSLKMKSRGRGVVTEFCGSDVDPFGLSSTDLVCHASAFSTEGATVLTGRRPDRGASYAFADRTVAVGYCDAEGSLRVTTNYGTDPGSAVAWPCAELLSLEIDEAGALLPVIRFEERLYVPTRRGVGGQPTNQDAGGAGDAGTPADAG